MLCVKSTKKNMAMEATVAGTIGFIMENVINDLVIIKTKTDEKEIRNEAIETPLYPYHMINIGEITQVKTVHKIMK